MAEANVTNNNQLSPEVLVKIFEHCDLNELVNIVEVCQLWRDVAVHQHMSLNDLVIRRPDDINDLVSLLCKPVSFTKLHVLWNEHSYCSSVSLDALANVTSLNHLQSFTFKVKETGLGYYREVLDALLTLILQTSTDTLTHLKLFNIRCYPTSTKIVEIIETCQHLSHLVLKGCKLYDEVRRRCENIIPTLTHLELLDLRGTKVPGNLSFVAAVKRGCPNISNNIRVRSLDVGPSDDVSVLQFVSHVDTLLIARLRTEQLRSIISYLNKRVSQLSVDQLLCLLLCMSHDDILLSFVQCLRGLKCFYAHGCRQLTNEGVVNVIRSSPQLERIDIIDIEQNINKDLIPLLDRVVTKKNVLIDVRGTKLSGQRRNKPDCGRNGIICFKYSAVGAGDITDSE